MANDLSPCQVSDKGTGRLPGFQLPPVGDGLARGGCITIVHQFLRNGLYRKMAIIWIHS